MAGEAVFGVFARAADPLVAEALAATNLDFVVLDIENGALNWTQVGHWVACALARGFPVVLRIGAVSLLEVQHAIASGAAGIIASHVADAAQARAIGAFARTSGIARAYAGMATTTNFRTVAWPDYERTLREEFLVLVQVDDADAAGKAQAIAQAEGIDGLFIGTLTLELSHRGGRAGAEAAVHDVLAACSQGKRRAGMHAAPRDCASAIAAGANLIVLANELNMLRSAANDLVAHARHGGSE